MKKSILNIISLMCCLTIMLTATSCGNNAKKEETIRCQLEEDEAGEQLTMGNFE